MKNRNRNTTLMTVTLAVALTLTATVQAQPRGGGFRLDPEEQAKIHDLQAQAVASHLGLEENSAQKLTAAYKACRERLDAALRESFAEGDREEWRARMEKMRELGEVERETFSKEVAGILDEEKAKEATAVLGSFSRSWDMTTRSLDEIVSEQATKKKAVYTAGKVITEAESKMTEGDREARRESRREMMEDLSAELEKVLSAEEFSKWKENADRFRGRGRGGQS